MQDFSVKNIYKIIQSILDVSFVNFPQEKRNMIDRSGYISFACPICGDSEHNIQAKRGTLYKNTLLYRCWNCDHRSNLLNLSRHYNISIDLKEKLQMIEYVNDAMNKMSFNNDDFISKGMDKLILLDDLIDYTKNNYNSPLTDLKPVQKGSVVYKYLIDRKITDFTNIYQAIFWKSEKWNEPVLVNMNMSIKDNKVLGLQVRNLISDKSKRLYKIYKFSEIYKMIFPDKILDEIEEIGYNKLSYLYNIMNIDLNNNITVFEGFLDTKFFPNSIGMVGKNTDPTILLNQDLNIRFFFDYDRAGIEKALEYMDANQKVFLWEKMFNYWSNNLKDSNKMYRKLTNGQIIDLNDVAKKIINPYEKLKLENWFSIDKFDKLYLR